MKDNSLTLHLRNSDDITVPDVVLKSKLSLAEIGLVVSLLAVKEGHIEFCELVNDPVMKDVSASLKAKGILTISLQEGVVNIGVDLEGLG